MISNLSNSWPVINSVILSYWFSWEQHIVVSWNIMFPFIQFLQVDSKVKHRHMAKATTSILTGWNTSYLRGMAPSLSPSLHVVYLQIRFYNMLFHKLILDTIEVLFLLPEVWSPLSYWFQIVPLRNAMSCMEMPEKSKSNPSSSLSVHGVLCRLCLKHSITRMRTETILTVGIIQ